jgi:Flp pilus assembly protein TadG
MQRKERRIRQRGSALIETGLIFTVFAVMLIGAADFGQFLFIHQALVERARNAARWGALSDPTNVTAIQNMVMYNGATAPDDQSSGYFGLTRDCIQVTNPGSGTNDSRVAILITNYRYTVLSPYIGGSYTGPNIAITYPVSQ